LSFCVLVKRADPNVSDPLSFHGSTLSLCREV
jgi:hypothetical protein